MNRVKHALKSLWFHGKLSTKYAIADASANKRNFFVGLSTVLLVVMFVVLLQNAISKSSLIWVRLAEEQVGEFDVVLTPQFSSVTTESLAENGIEGILLNSTFINETLTREVDSIRGATPRWTVLGTLQNANNASINASTVVLVIDSEREEQLGIGRAWKRRPLGEAEAYVSSSLLRQIGARGGRGERVRLAFDLAELGTSLGLFDADQFADIAGDTLEDLLRNATDTLLEQEGRLTLNVTELLENAGITIPPDFSIPNVNISAVDFLDESTVDDIIAALAPSLGGPGSFLVPSTELTVVEGVGAPAGKWPKSLGNVVVLEKSHVAGLIRSLLPPNPIGLANLLRTLMANATAVTGFNDTSSSQVESVEQVLDTIGDLENFLDTADIDHFALIVLVALKDRLSLYETESKAAVGDVIDITNDMYNALGFRYPATPTVPVLTALEGIYYIRLFLEQVFGATMAIMVGLGSILIFSLLLSNVNEKTYEYGMLRALGFQRTSLVALLLVQALFFTIPGITLGLFACWMLNVPITIILNGFSKLAGAFDLRSSAVGLGVVIGLTVPLLALFVPIKRALSRTLRDSLDVYHTVASETQVRMVRLAALGLSGWQIALSLMMICAGFLVYYLIPYSFTFDNIRLFLTILTIILLGMVLGFCLIATAVQPMLERGMIHIVMWRSATRLKTLVRKSLAGHRSRNRKTALMFTIALAFTVFAGASFTLQGNAIKDGIRANLGADLYVRAPDYGSALPTDELRDFLQKEVDDEVNGKVESFTFSSFALNDHPGMRSVHVTNLAGDPDVEIQLRALESNLLNTVDPYFYIPSEHDTKLSYTNVKGTSKPDVILSLYEDAGNALLPQEQNGILVPPDFTSDDPYGESSSYSGYDNRTAEDYYTNYIDVVMSEAMRNGAVVSVDTPLQVQMEMSITTTRKHSAFYLGKARALVTKLPGYFLSSYSQTAPLSPVFITYDSYSRLLRRAELIRLEYEKQEDASDALDVSTDIGNQLLFVKMRSGSTSLDREYVINGMSNFISNDETQLIDVPGLIKTTDTATSAMIIFFNIVAVINSILCFFLLWLSFDSNVRENSWEFGVLRAIGLSAKQAISVYVYEAICIVLSSMLLGTVIGLGVALTLTLQFNLFTELPFQFSFPWALYWSVIVISFAVSMLGAWIPASQLRQRPISAVLRGGT